MRRDGRWSSKPADTKLRFACTNVADPVEVEHWKVSKATGPLSAGESECARLGPGYRFAAPVRAMQNRALRAAADGAGAQDLWLNLRRSSNGGWHVNQNLATCPVSTFQAPQCTASKDCYEHVPGDLASPACCSGRCAKRVKDYAGIPFCPEECKVSASAPPGSCGAGDCYSHFRCGGEGQPACTIEKCFPSCSGGRKEVGGVCRNCQLNTTSCSSNGQCCSNKCYRTCPFGSVDHGATACCKDVFGNEDRNNCGPKACGI